MFLRRKNQAGQAVLVILLSLSVVLIIVLYIMSRSVTDITLSSKEEDSMRAFSAAEAGVERALVIGSDIGNTAIGDASFTADVSDFGRGQTQVVYPMNLKSGEMATFWFTRASEPAFTGNSVTICWGTSAVEPPAIEATIYYLTAAGSYRIARATVDPNSGRTVTNNFSVASSSSCTIDNISFRYNTSLNLSSLSGLQFMTVKLLYNTTESHKIGINVSGSGSMLPSQGVKVNSLGMAVDANRSIEVYQLHPVVPSLFMNAIYSSTGIVKNN